MKWTLNNETVGDATSAWAMWIIEFTLCGTILMMLIFVVGWLLRHRSATMKHAWYTTGQIGLLTLPVLLLTLQPWTIAPVPRVLMASGKAETLRVFSGNPQPIAHDDVTADVDFHRETLANDFKASFKIPVPANSNANVQAKSGSLLTATQLEPTRRTANVNWKTTLIILWLLGVATCLLRLIGSATWLFSLRPTHLSPGDCARILTKSASRQLEDQGATVALVEREIMPMAVGIWKKRIVLPQSAMQLDSNARDAIVLHELGHLSRRDPLWHLIAELSRAFFWFHPLHWIVVHQCAVNREQACDDLVLRGGFAPHQYAHGLLHAVATYCPVPRQCVGVAMANRKPIENRIRSVMNPQQNRQPLSRNFTMLAIAVTLCSCIALSVVRAADPPVTSSPENPDATIQDTEPTQSTPPQSAELAPQTPKNQPLPSTPDGKSPVETLEVPAANPKPVVETVSQAPKEKTLSGRVLNEQGETIAGARILHNWFDNGKTRSIQETANRLGEFSITYPSQDTSFEYFMTWISGGQDSNQSIAMSPVFGDSTSIANADIRLPKGDKVAVRVLSPEGLPVAGAMVYPESMDVLRMQQGPRGEMIEGKSMFSAPIPASWVESLSVRTNHNGEATLTSFQQTHFDHVIVQSDKFGQQKFYVRKTSQELRLSPVGSIRGNVVYDHPDQIAGQTVFIRGVHFDGGGKGMAKVELNDKGEFHIHAFAAQKIHCIMYWDNKLPMHPVADRMMTVKENEELQLTISTVPAVKVRGEVLTSDSKQPVAGARVFLNCLRSPLNGSTTKTDADGRFELYVAPGKAIRQVTSMGSDRSFYKDYDYPRMPMIEIPDGADFTLPTFYFTPKQVVSGLVRDRQGKPVAGKTIAFHNGTSRRSLTATTDAHGRFTEQARNWNLIHSESRISKDYGWSIGNNVSGDSEHSDNIPTNESFTPLNVLRNLPTDMLLELP
ncbi:M56 family metallopeptidase [Planctomycetes bacterium K23_9]|uniref:Regulatory protein BlaR1 n=1 Tax=Stieleria marina TaxID=1930275 RepID=A0A517NP81_9BACT|nr:Regulatory protein BlaR1 [Planctomycetes bacterium K23_9]